MYIYTKVLGTLARSIAKCNGELDQLNEEIAHASSKPVEKVDIRIYINIYIYIYMFMKRLHMHHLNLSKRKIYIYIYIYIYK
jgi:hypothetical protein